MLSTIKNTIKKHKKAILIGGGALAALYIMRKSASSKAPRQMPIGPTVQQLKSVNGALGSLE